MSKTMEYAAINSSPTINVKAGETFESIGGKAIQMKEGKAVLPTVGEMVAGIALLTQEEKIMVDEDITIQIKDIGYWIAGGEIAVGDCLTSDAEGYCQKATTGQYIFARALSEATTKADIIKVQIIHAGYAK